MAELNGFMYRYPPEADQRRHGGLGYITPL